MKLNTSKRKLILSISLLIVACFVCYFISIESPILLQVLLNGVLMGGLFGLMAMGLTLVFGIMKVPVFVWGFQI